MAIEHRNPLPPGQYSVDVFSSDQEAFRLWLEKNAASVRVDSEEMHIADGYLSYTFSVDSPAEWEGPGLPDIVAEAPTPNPYQKPPLEQAEQAAGEVLDAAESGIKGALTIGGLILGGIVLWRLFS